MATPLAGRHRRDHARVDVRPAPLHLVDPRLAARVAAPAHDTIDATERADVVRRHPDSFLHVYADMDEDPGGGVARDDHGPGSPRLRELIRAGTFRALPGPAFAIYQLREGAHRQRGVVADVAVDSYDAGLVRPHEATRADKERALMRSLRATRMSSSPVCLAYEERPEVTELVDEVAAGEPDLSFTSHDGVAQTVWVVARPDRVAALHDAITALDRLYIVDGHHRCAAASRDLARARTAGVPGVDRETFLGALFASSQLCVGTFHRCVARPARTAADLLAQLARDFVIEPVGVAERARPRRAHELGMLMDGAWYRLRVRPSAVPACLPGSLDVVLLRERVLRPLGIDDPDDDPRVDHVPGTTDLGVLAARCAVRSELAFVLHPVSMAQLRAVADDGGVLPPKSTSVRPKLGSGVFVRLR